MISGKGNDLAVATILPDLVQFAPCSTARSNGRMLQKQMPSTAEQGSFMRIRVINQRPKPAVAYESVADNIFTDICEDIQIQSPMIDRPSLAAASVLRPSAFSQVRRLKTV